MSIGFISLECGKRLQLEVSSRTGEDARAIKIILKLRLILNQEASLAFGNQLRLNGTWLCVLCGDFHRQSDPAFVAPFSTKGMQFLLIFQSRYICGINLLLRSRESHLNSIILLVK